MIHGAKKPTPKLHKAPQPSLSRAGAIPDSDRARFLSDGGGCEMEKLGELLYHECWEQVTKDGSLR
jgi:hypothetical protein